MTETGHVHTAGYKADLIKAYLAYMGARYLFMPGLLCGFWLNELEKRNNLRR